ncbi:hypothetical protein B7Z28_00990 [Candidatus Saccharibacteria bacterium 32-45-3]|nr:MAG: hypothetical protein B7Z28_00990 [Candidatus Saccharibacteria bacterium 32-45-3]
MHKRISGFTIVELLIVIVVIGILATISVVVFNGITSRAMKSATDSDIRNIKKTLQVRTLEIGGGFRRAAEMKNSGVLASYGDKVQYDVTGDTGSLYNAQMQATNTPRGSYLFDNYSWAYSTDPNVFTSNLYLYYWDYDVAYWRCSNYNYSVSRDPVLIISEPNRCETNFFDRATNQQPCRAARVEECIWIY